MPTHWTYASFTPGDDLRQGDILVPGGALSAILRDVHPHFLASKYTAFLITTQSCDLVRRGGSCATRYLNLAVIRPLGDVLHDLLESVCETVATGIYVRETKGDANRLLQRIFNQNEQSLGLFYLHPDSEAGIEIPSVSLLRVEVALRASHYKALLGCRRGRLRPEFTAKLGWLVGNLYSRIGTPDWSEQPQGKKQLDELVKDALKQGEVQCHATWVPKETLRQGEYIAAPAWVPKSWVEAARKDEIDFSGLARDRVFDVLEKYKPVPALDAVACRVSDIVKKALLELPGGRLSPEAVDELSKKIRNLVANDSDIANTVRNRPE